MQIVIVSDSHGNVANLKHVCGFAKKINAFGIVHCGDWGTAVSVEVVASYNISLYSVLGNADVDPLIESKLSETSVKFDKKFLTVDFGGKRTGIIHDIRLLPSFFDPDMVFTGHFHSQKIWSKNGARFVRPGALENEISFAVYDTNTNKIELIHG